MSFPIIAIAEIYYLPGVVFDSFGEIANGGMIGEQMQKYLFQLITFLSLTSTSLAAMPSGSVELIDGRLKVQFSVLKDQSKGTFQLRSILEQDGFKNDDGFVKTDAALAPLEIYNYLYENGTYVFTIFLPVNDKEFFVAFGDSGFVSFSGLAAQKLFEVVKRHVSQDDLSDARPFLVDIPA